MKSVSRLLHIISTFYRFGLLALLDLKGQSPWWLRWLQWMPGQNNKLSLPERLRLALESLGPIFIKFGQLLSVRQDILPADYTKALSRLQDDVTPFSGDLAKTQIEDNLHQAVDVLFVDFDLTPVASASVAQVHHAWLRESDGSRGPEVAIKVLRPGIQSVIEKDLVLLYQLARWLEKYLRDGSRLRLFDIVAEFDKSLHGELDLMREAANTSQLKRYFSDEQVLLIPEVYFDYCARDVMTMQWMTGIPVSKIDLLKQQGIDLSELAQRGITIFFTQVFKHGFFHADMHPGNILISADGRYITLDCGIAGTLTAYDKRYLAINFLAFFNRDYHRVATAHVECGWVPPDCPVDELESAIRTVCEPIFEKPLSKISCATLLMRLFEVSRNFKIHIQPQLILLQKALIHIESLGRELDPHLNLWATAKPFLTQWMKEQVGLRGFVHALRKEMPDWVYTLPKLPRKLYELISEDQASKPNMSLSLITAIKRQNRVLCVIALLLAGIAGVLCCFLVW